MRKKNAHFISLSSSLMAIALMNSCAGPESYQSKMQRYTPKTSSKNTVPHIQLASFKFEPVSKGRGPASNEMPKENSFEKNQNESQMTNKKLYFLTLNDQYETLKKYSNEFTAPSVSICPNFHTSLLIHNEKYTSQVQNKFDKKFTYDLSKLNDEFYITTKPELQLPVSKNETYPKVIDLLRNSKDSMNDFAVNELVHKALDIHLSKTYTEIKELCENGVSDNYYIYENLITHIKSHPFNAEEANMNILLKTSLFANHALVNSLVKHTKEKGRSIASTEEIGHYSKEIMTRLNVSWTKQYYDTINESR